MDKKARENLFKAIIIIIGVAVLLHPSLILAGFGKLIWVGILYFMSNLVSWVIFGKSIRDLFRE